MWFNSAIVYQYTLEQDIDLNALLSTEILKPCPPHARFTFGWLPALADEMVHEVAGAQLICFGKEERLLPRSVIQRTLEERVSQIETQQGRGVKRNEKSQLMEDIEFELLPKSFCLQKKTNAIIDEVEKRIIINSSSENQAGQLLSLLRKSVKGLNVEPIPYPEQLSLRFASWINNPSTLPKNFSLANDCVLFSLEDEKKKINCKGYEMPAEEVLTLLAQGLTPYEISLNWNDHIQFTLTHDFLLKRIKCLDYLNDEFHDIRNIDEEYQQQDAALALLGGELRALISELIADFKSTEKSKTFAALDTAAI